MKLADLKPGDRIKGFNGLYCIPDRATRTVQRDKKTGELFVQCLDGQHFLGRRRDGKGGELVGLSRVEVKSVAKVQGELDVDGRG